MIEELKKHFIRRKLTLSLAESITGGAVAASIVRHPDVSSFFLGSLVVYSNEAKIALLGVSPKNIEAFGAVSEEIALEMACGAKEKFKSTISVAITGIAGPTGGSQKKPVGTVCFAFALENEVFTETKHFLGSREQIIDLSVSASLESLLSFLV